MKYLLLLITLLHAHTAVGQNGYLPVDKSRTVSYSDLGKLTKSKSEVYKQVQDWVVKTFGNYANAVQKDDPVNGKLLISSYVPVQHSRFDHIRFDLVILIQDSLYQARIENLDGISQLSTPVRLSEKDNDAITVQETIVKTENYEKKRVQQERKLRLAQEDIDGINTAMYYILSKLKVYMSPNGGAH